ncbi:hypothetical protein ACLOJK_026848, partial [Asimina triloba]
MAIGRNGLERPWLPRFEDDGAPYLGALMVYLDRMPPPGICGSEVELLFTHCPLPSMMLSWPIKMEMMRTGDADDGGADFHGRSFGEDGALNGVLRQCTEIDAHAH